MIAFGQLVLIKSLQNEVEVATGTPGWWKRINRSTTEVDRSTHLKDEHTIDSTGEAVETIVQTAKKMILKNHKPSVTLPQSTSHLDVSRL